MKKQGSERVHFFFELRMCRRKRSGESTLEIGEQDFGVQAAVGEDDGLQAAAEKLFRDAGGFVEVTAALVGPENGRD